MKNPYCLLTNDVETTSIWHNSLRDETGKKVLNEGMPILLDIYKKYNIKSTFFFTGYIANLYPKIVKMIISDGHEVASHGMSHHKKDSFDLMPLSKQIAHLKESKKLLEDISGQEVISFRAPALTVNYNTVIALEEAEYKIDSSVASQRFDMFMSFGGLKKLNWLTAPREPYRASCKNIFAKGKSSILEIPLSATILPYLGTTMRIFPRLTSLQRKFIKFESKTTNKPIVFDIHPNEFIDESNEPREFIRRSNNIISSFLQDTLRSKLKTRNLGRGGGKLYEREINSISKSKFEFTTIKKYVKNLKI